ncbi:MAG: hypothetical protein NTZ27_09550 [Ignavibacteriales bacterium]|nr:hypothetical protein [Ignavibacteriales bacterium]
MKKIFTILFTLILLVIPNHAYQKEFVSIIPKPAKMEISYKILYFESGGDQSLKLEYETADMSRRIVPVSLFYIK